MNLAESARPVEALIGGAVGAPFVILSFPEVRSAKRLRASQEFHTADGVIIGRPGDVAMIGYSGKRWPIKRSVFLGTYRVLGRVGEHLAAQRLVHPRIAWKVESEGGGA